MSRPLRLCAAALITSALLLPTVSAATAATPRPGAPTGVKVSAATPSSFTVTSNKATNAKKYVLIASLVKSDVFFQNLNKPSKHRIVVTAGRPEMTVKGQSYTTRPYFFRVQTKNGDRTNLSDMFTAYLAPKTPTNVTADYVDGTALTGLALHWDHEQAAGFTVAQATDRTMDQNLKTYNVKGNVTQFTPPGLAAGQYYFQVRAVNGGSASKFSGVVPGFFNGVEAGFSMMTWNVLHSKFDGTKENGYTIAKWSKRLPVVVSMIKQADPDIIVINEANDWLDKAPHHTRYRQINSLADQLGDYQLCDADFSDNTYHPRTGNYVLYRINQFRAVGPAGYFTDNSRSSDNLTMYQELIDVKSGALFYVDALHFPAGANTAKYDAVRKTSAKNLIEKMNKLQADNKTSLPVIYAGDTNSYAGSNPDNYDSPGDLFAADGATDSLMAAQKATNTKYGSVNGYTPKPSQTGRIIDHLYGTGGVAFQNWNQVMNLKNGRWPGVVPSDHNPIMAQVSVQS